MIRRELALIFLFFHCFMSSSFAQGIYFRVLGAKEKVLFEGNFILSGESVGEISNTLLEQALAQKKLIQYVGSESAVLSINNLGTAYEIPVADDTQMAAYGWCYRVDGRLPLDLRPDEYKLTGEEAQIEWFYAYAHYDKGEWKPMCVPADHEPVQE